MTLDGGQACRIETRSGATVEGELLALDLPTGTVRFRTSPEGPGVRLMLARIRSVTLTARIYLEENPSLESRQGRATERSESEFALDWLDVGPGSLAGVTAGFIAAAEGLFLFPSSDNFTTCERVFVPRSAYRELQVAPLQPHAPQPRGVASLAALLEAIDAQETAPILRIGESLIDLGLLSRVQLDYALSEQDADVPLGEMLVAAGTISRVDLLTALAHKMGYPFVDLGRFPIEARAAALLPYGLANALCALPIAWVGERLIVVMDRPTSLARLRDIPAIASLRIATVVAPADQIRAAIARQPHPDLWSANVP
jgi:hypothetical protein